MTEEITGATADPDGPVPATMRAITQDRYGGPDVLELRQVATPAPSVERVLVRVVASSLNMYDWHMITGTPFMARMMTGFAKPKRPIPGADLAGVVVHVGENVSGFAIGDHVFGDTGFGAFAEYASVNPKAIVAKPPSVGFEEAASIPLAGLTALQGLRDIGGLEAGQRVIVNGASGGVGTFAVQIAVALGAEVTAVCSTTKVATATSIGAGKVLDYTEQDFTASERNYDLLLDNVGNRPWSETRRVLADGGINVTVTGPKHRVLGPLRNLAFRKVASRLGNERFTWFTAAVKAEDMAFLGSLVASGDVVPVIEDAYPLEQLSQALDYLGKGHAGGKLIITM